MKYLLFTYFLFHLLPQTFSQVGIGTTNPDPSAKLDISSSTLGFLPPRMTTAERNAINAPAVGLIIFNTTSGCINVYSGTQWREICPTVIVGTIAALNCSSPTIVGSLTSSVAASGVSSTVTFTGSSGNGDSYPAQVVPSTGITGLTATLPAGNFNSLSGSLTYSISGTPSTFGSANFALNIGGQTCAMVLPVAFQCAVSTVTFTYRGSTVTYGTVVGANGKCWLDRNLGASRVATSSTDASGYGDLFQWGRGDDNHQDRSSSTTSTLSSSDNPGNGNFIINPSSTGDWRNPQNDNLWQGAAGVNNPCPSGFRLPTLDELWTERNGWSSFNQAGAFASSLKLTTGGFRSYYNGALDLAGTYVNYWTSSVLGSYASVLLIDGSQAVQNISERATGASVRCIKD
jgi:uncharacterized protein (TIGR02145 family)